MAIKRATTYRGSFLNLPITNRYPPHLFAYTKNKLMKTAVEFLHAALSLHFTQKQEMQFVGLFQQALELEKEQIIKAYQQGVTEEYGDTLDFSNDKDAEEYYNHTFKND
jgi:hypothetical protein